MVVNVHSQGFRITSIPYFTVIPDLWNGKSWKYQAVENRCILRCQNKINAENHRFNRPLYKGLKKYGCFLLGLSMLL
jgi:hypothetical protein